MVCVWVQSGSINRIWLCFKKYFECAYYRTRMSTDSYATSSASESQEPEIGGEMMVVEGSFKYKSWLWEHFILVLHPEVSVKSTPQQSAALAEKS